MMSALRRPSSLINTRQPKAAEPLSGTASTVTLHGHNEAWPSKDPNAPRSTKSTISSRCSR